MDAREIRRLNLRQLVREFGSTARLAEAAGSSAKTLDQILAGTPLESGQPRGVGHNLARRIEEAARKPPGWLDVVHEEELPVQTRELLEYLRSRSIEGKLGAEQVRAIYHVAKAMESA